MQNLIKISILLTYSLFAVDANAQDRLLVVNKDSNSLSVLNPESGETEIVLKTGKGPHEVAVTPDQQTAVVTNYGFGCANGSAGRSLTVVDLKTYQIKTIDLGQYKSPHGVVAMNDNKHVVVTVECSQAVLVVDLIQGEVVKAIDTHAGGSHMVVLSHDQNKAFTANLFDGSASVLDLVQGEHIKTIKTGNGAEGIDISPDGSQVWVSNRDDNTVSVIDVDLLMVKHTIDVGKTPIRLKFNPVTKNALISNATSATVEKINSNHQVTTEIQMKSKVNDENGSPNQRFRTGPVPIGILINPKGDKAFVANTNVHEIKVLDLVNNQVLTSFTAEQRPDGLAWVSSE